MHQRLDVCHNREIEEEDRQLSSQKSLLEKRLQEEISNSRTQVSHANRLEKNVRDLRVELEQKIEIGKSVCVHKCVFHKRCMLQFLLQSNVSSEPSILECRK